MIGNIIKKEFKELFLLSTLLPIVVIAIVFGSVGNMIGNVGETMKEKPVIGIVDMDDGNFSDIAMSVLTQNAKVVYNGSDAARWLARSKEREWRCASGNTGKLQPKHLCQSSRGNRNLLDNERGGDDGFHILKRG